MSMTRFKDMADDLLKDFSLEELLEMNDLTDTEVLAMLIQYGLINEPEHTIEERTASFSS